MRLIKAAVVLLSLLTSVAAAAQAVEVDDDSAKGKADQYFQKRKPASRKAKEQRTPAAENNAPHFLALHLGTYLDDQAYRWGHGDQHDIGELNIGVTYRLGEWINSADFAVRSEFSSYSLDEGSARKLSFIAMIFFPDASSRFPLYFGAGAGPGFYLKQIHGQSVMSVDYQLVAGARFLNVIDNLGFFLEFGIKNDIQVFSEGQFNGLFIGAGTAWTF